MSQKSMFAIQTLKLMHLTLSSEIHHSPPWSSYRVLCLIPLIITKAPQTTFRTPYFETYQYPTEFEIPGHISLRSISHDDVMQCNSDNCSTTKLLLSGSHPHRERIFEFPRKARRMSIFYFSILSIHSVLRHQVLRRWKRIWKQSQTWPWKVKMENKDQV